VENIAGHKIATSYLKLRTLYRAISGSKTEKPIPMTSLNINTRAVIALGIVIDFLDPANPRARRILDI